MARKKVVTTREELDGTDATAAEIAVPETETVDADDVLETLAGTDGRKYRVHKFPSKPGEGGAAFCQDYTKEEFDPAAIRATFGGGQFRVTVFDERNQIINSKRITLADLPKPAAVAAAAAPAGADQNVLVEMFRAQSAMLSAILSKPAAVAPAGPSAMELVALIKALTPDTGSDPVKLLLQGLELGKGIGGGGDTGVLDLAKSGFEALAPLIAKQAATPAPQVHQITPRIGQNGTTPNPAAGPVPQETEEQKVQAGILQKLNWLRQVTARLVQRAHAQKSPELAAELFLEDLPPFILIEEVAERFKDQASIAQLAQLDPNVAAFAPWFEIFRGEVMSLIEEEEEEPARPDIEGAAPSAA